MKADENGAFLLTPDFFFIIFLVGIYLKHRSHIELFNTIRCHFLMLGRGHAHRLKGLSPSTGLTDQEHFTMYLILNEIIMPIVSTTSSSAQIINPIGKYSSSMCEQE